MVHGLWFTCTMIFLFQTVRLHDSYGFHQNIPLSKIRFHFQHIFTAFRCPSLAVPCSSPSWPIIDDRGTAPAQAEDPVPLKPSGPLDPEHPSTFKFDDSESLRERKFTLKAEGNIRFTALSIARNSESALRCLVARRSIRGTPCPSALSKACSRLLSPYLSQRMPWRGVRIPSFKP
jgi:hypothetical protein